MSGPHTAKARRPNWVLVRRTTAALVIVERSRRWVPTELNSTRSDRYVGHRWWRTWCISHFQDYLTIITVTEENQVNFHVKITKRQTQNELNELSNTVYMNRYKSSIIRRQCSQLQSLLQNSVQIRKNHNTRTGLIDCNYRLSAGPTVWNSLPNSLRNPAVGPEQFRRTLKTHLFACC